MTRPLTVSMTPAFIYEGDWLLRAQLRCLSEQRAKDFDVLIIDPHYIKRVGYMPELAAKYRLNITHVLYMPNQNVAKRLDCAVFNAAYCYSESPRIVRYSCWRFVTPDFTQTCLESETNVDFRFHSIEPVKVKAEFKDCNAETNHNTAIWDFGSDEVHWDKVPQNAGESGATWGPDSDVDEPATLFPRNCYGNYMVFRDQWLNINGTDETFTNTAHYEDMDFCLRARTAGMQCSRKAHQLFRMHHFYGNHSGRANIRPDHEFKNNCPQCEAACSVLEPNRFDIKARAGRGEITVEETFGVWVCKTCSLCGPLYHTGCHEHLEGHIEKHKVQRANCMPKYRLGRNLRTVTADMDGKSLADKVTIYNDSWTNERYYH